jgi:hypothetical protein
MIPEEKRLFEIDCLIPKELLRIDSVNPLPFFHQFFRDLLVGCEVATIACEKPKQTMRRISTDQEVSHSLVIVKILAAQWTFELDPQTTTPSEV